MQPKNNYEGVHVSEVTRQSSKLTSYDVLRGTIKNQEQQKEGESLTQEQKLETAKGFIESENKNEVTGESSQSKSYEELRGTLKEQKKRDALDRLVEEERKKEEEPLTEERKVEIAERFTRAERQRQIRNYRRIRRAVLFLGIVFDGARTIKNWNSHWHHVAQGAADIGRVEFILEGAGNVQRYTRELLDIDTRVVRGLQYLDFKTRVERGLYSTLHTLQGVRHGLQSTQRALRRAPALVWRHLRTSPYPRPLDTTQLTNTNTQASIRKRNRDRLPKENIQHRPWPERLRPRKST